MAPHQQFIKTEELIFTRCAMLPESRVGTQANSMRQSCTRFMPGVVPGTSWQTSGPGPPPISYQATNDIVWFSVAPNQMQ